MKVLVADDHAIVRKGLKQILLEEYPFVEIEECANAEELVQKANDGQWDVIISDISMPGRSGLEALQQIRLLHPRLPVLILSMHPEEQYAIRALKAGASGYCSKDLAHDELVNAIRRILTGKKYITPSLAENLATKLEEESLPEPYKRLSDREFDVFKLLVSGKSISDIADNLSLSTTTISTYRARILVKMNLKTNADLIRYALEKKLI
ncbi:DNA-binding response regulator [Niastella koreensis]|uniref:Two component transcriptional regulator, LuxR family n=2 Tax=Niastella koreensis TaxID=354356 RepID=G8TIY2_NIAKG|nr:response regulator transcription factor [Niastella koreensis]AEV97499.1 two component transcriptional regulator, LuxR family [Niastella koreensis GR20-10]OQP47683.1 DNA-binding response regulator [Niastella koreensis]